METVSHHRVFCSLFAQLDYGGLLLLLEDLASSRLALRVVEFRTCSVVVGLLSHVCDLDLLTGFVVRLCSVSLLIEEGVLSDFIGPSQVH